MKDYYEILGVPPNASKAYIKEVFRKLAHIYHPDKGGNERKFKEINEAYQTLSDDRKRAEYDSHLRQPNGDRQPNPERSYKETVTESPKAERIYDVSNKIKSSKWNAFLLKDNEVEEYLADGIHIQNDGFLSGFSREKRNDNARRSKRWNSLLNQRTINISNEYTRHITIPLEKEIVSAIVKSTKNNDSFQQKLEELIENEKKESGDIVACFPLVDEGWSGKVLFITTNGICFMVVNEGNLRFNLMGGLAQTLGPIGVGIGHLVGSLVHKHRINKIQQTFIRLATTYSACLLARCFPGSQYVPYNMINVLKYDEKMDSANSVINFVYANGRQEFFKVTRDMMLEIVKILSGDNPPRHG